LAGEEKQMFKALVLMPNEKTSEFGSLLAVARDAARKREETRTNPPIRVLHFIAELGIYVAIYEVIEKPALNREVEKGS
jgi:hypothetical protein